MEENGVNKKATSGKKEEQRRGEIILYVAPERRQVARKKARGKRKTEKGGRMTTDLTVAVAWGDGDHVGMKLKKKNPGAFQPR